MVDSIFSVITDAIEGFISSLTAGVNGMVSLVYDATLNNGAGGFTFVGILLMIAVGIGVVYWCFRLIRGLTAGLAR